MGVVLVVVVGVMVLKEREKERRESEDEPARDREEALAGGLLELRPVAVGGLRETDVLGRAVGRAHDARGVVRGAAGVPELVLLEGDDLRLLARQVVRGRAAQRAHSDDGDVELLHA